MTYSEACGDVFSEAVREGDVELVRFLLESGQDPNVAQGSGHDGFWEIGAWAVLGEQPSRAFEILGLMLKHGWVQKPSRDQSGAAHVVAAAKVGHMDVLRLLVEDGADLELGHSPSLKDKRGHSCLCSAKQGGNDKIVMIEKKGSD